MQGMEVRSVSPEFVGEVHGLNLTKPISDSNFADIDTAIAHFGVLVFPGQDLSDAQQIAFSQRFGEIENAHGGNPTQKKKRLNAQINDVSNLNTDGTPLARDDRRRAFNLGNHLWHTDSSFRAVPAKYSLLSARRIPATGGNTEFADMRAAYDALDPAMKSQIEPLICEHSLLHSRARLGFTKWTAEEIEMMKPVRQALVRQHPATGRKSIYISSHAGHVVGWTEAESKLFLSDLTEIATQRAFVYTHEWTVNDLVMWDNRCVLHRARSYEPGVVRDMRRTTIAGDEATVAQAA